MTIFFYWSGVALWIAIACAACWLLSLLAIHTVQATIFAFKWIAAGEGRIYRKPREWWAIWSYAFTVSPDGVIVRPHGADKSGRHVTWPGKAIRTDHDPEYDA